MNARAIPVELTLEVSECLPPDALKNLGLTNKLHHEITHPIMIRKSLFKQGCALWINTEPFFQAFLWRSLPSLLTFYNFRGSEQEMELIKEEVNTIAVRLFAKAYKYHDFDALDELLDHPYIFDLDPHSDEFLRSHHMFCQHSHLSVLKHLYSRGCKLPREIFQFIPDILFAEHLPEDLCVWLIEEGFDIDARRDGCFETVLIQACRWRHAPAIEMLLRLGANPNGIGLLPGVKDRRRKDFLTRPLDILLNNDTNRMWRRNWQSAAPILYRCVKPLIEHGASTSPAPYASDPIRILLDNIWRFLCPVARHAAKVGKKGQTTISQLLDALLTAEVDIRPLDKLCDIVVDANPEYTRRSKGLRGKERLVRLLRQRKDALPLSFYWKSRDLWVFKAKRRHPKYDHINDEWVLSKRQHGHSRYIYYGHESESDDYSESDDDDEEYEDEERELE